MADTIRPTERQQHVEVPQGDLERSHIETKEVGVSEILEIPRDTPSRQEIHERQSASSTVQSTAVQSTKTDLMKRVEQILEEEVGEVYFTMNAAEQERFKKKGEETARTIEGLIAKARATASHLIALVRAWLKLIPGVSAFFLEQEAKIKTDKLMHLQQRRKE